VRGATPRATRAQPADPGVIDVDQRGATPPASSATLPSTVAEMPAVRCWTAPGHTGPRPAPGPGLTFDVAADGTRRTPRPIPAVALSPGGPDEPLPVLGLARFFPGGTLHGVLASAPPGGEPCPLTDTDHLHVRQVEASLDALLEPAPAMRDALAALIRTPSPAAVEAFQRSLRQAGTIDTLPAAEHTVTVTTVDDADGGYVFELSVLSAVDLLASDEAAAGAYAGVLHAAHIPSSVAPFLRALLAAARLDVDLAIVGTHDEALLCLFGCAAVRRECAVAVPVPAEPDDWWESLRAGHDTMTGAGARQTLPSS
jgi:hypothetical protein